MIDKLTDDRKLNFGDRFVKHLIDVGVYPYPTSSEKDFIVDRSRLEGWVRAFRESGAMVYIPLRHSKNPKDNTGWVEDIFIDGDSLYALINITDPVVAEKIKEGSIIHTSLGIEFNFTDDNGRTYPEIIRHIALTLDPHISKQKPFIELSRDREEELYNKVFHPLEEVVMPPEQNLYAYYNEKEQKGYFPHHNDDGSVSPSTLIDVLKQIDSENISEEIKKTAREHIYEHLIEVLSSLSDEKTALMERLSKFEFLERKNSKKMLLERVKILLKEGKITPNIERALVSAIERADSLEMETSNGDVFNLILDAISKIPPIVNTSVITRYASFNSPSISSDERQIMDKLGISEESYIKYSKKNK
ncbi:MAG: hypothetical protein ACUVWP_08975 [bacterium]